jgi:hypothetical protein
MGSLSEAQLALCRVGTSTSTTDCRDTPLATEAPAYFWFDNPGRCNDPPLLPLDPGRFRQFGLGQQ